MARAGLDREARPSGAESFIAGTASCRVRVDGVDASTRSCGSGRVHQVSRDGVSAKEFGAREFQTVDLDGNLITFFERVQT